MASRFNLAFVTSATRAIYSNGRRDVDNLGCYFEKEGNVLFNDALNTFYLRS